MTTIKPSVAIIAFAGFILVVSSGLYVTENILRANPDADTNRVLGNFSNTLDKFDEYEQEIGGMQSQIEAENPAEGAFGFLNSLITPAWNTLKGLFGSFAFITSALNGLGTIFGLPAFIFGTAVTVITAVFAFGILAVIFNRDP